MPRIVSLALIVLLLMAGGSAALAQGDAGVHLPPLHDIPVGWWHILRPGGQTACADGSPYSFVVYRGPTDKLLIYFQGGGACWDGTTCRNTHIYDSVIDMENAYDNPAREGDGFGIFDMDNPANPFRDYTVVYIPYCTGDMHIGENIIDYDGLVRQHRGAANGRDVLTWLYNSLAQPEALFIGGCSAGGIGAIYHAPFIIEHYPGVPTVVMADSAGVYRGDLSALFTAWRTTSILPYWLPGLAGANAQTLTFTQLFTAVASYYPDVTFAQFNSTGDMTQAYYTQLGINNVDPPADLLRDNLAEIHAAAPGNFYSYTRDGDIHCLTPREEMFDFARDGDGFLAWLAGLESGAPIAPVVAPPGLFE